MVNKLNEGIKKNLEFCNTKKDPFVTQTDRDPPFYENEDSELPEAYQNFDPLSLMQILQNFQTTIEQITKDLARIDMRLIRCEKMLEKKNDGEAKTR